jgi:hypothetical protein
MNVLVKLGGIMYVNTCSAMYILQCSYLQVFYYKSVFSQFRLGRSWKFFCKIRWALKCLSASWDGSPNLLEKFVIYLQPTLAVTLWPVPYMKRVMSQRSAECLGFSLSTLVSSHGESWQDGLWWNLELSVPV